MKFGRTVLAGLLLLAPLFATEAWSGVEGAKLYTGPDGIKLTLVRLSGEDPAAVILIQGSDSRFDGKALPYTLDEDGDRTRYRTQVEGRDYYPFHVTTVPGGTRTYTLYLGGNRRPVTLAYDEKGSQTLKPDDVVKRYEQQKKDGSLAKFQSFDRPKEQAQAEAGLKDVLKETESKCGRAFPVRVEWKSVTDELLKRYSLASYCGAPLEALQRLCEMPSVRDVLKSKVQRVECTFGSALSFELKDGVAKWTTSKDGSNLPDFARRAFEDALGGPAAPVPVGIAPWGKGQTLRELEAVDQTSVCTNNKAYYVVVAPSEKGQDQLFSGNGKTLTPTLPPAWGIPGNMFFEPRFPNGSANSDFRGSDMRVHSEIEVDRAKGTCDLRCGTRHLALSLLAPEAAKALLVASQVQPNPQEYRPHALLRDDHGRYYYVDKGLRKDNEKSFRVFIGNKGKLESQKLVNLVADSEGEVFSTKQGDLRLVVDRNEGSTWVRTGKRLKLRGVPLQENLPLIYNELGVYTGVKLGTPCDDAPL